MSWASQVGDEGDVGIDRSASRVSVVVAVALSLIAISVLPLQGVLGGLVGTGIVAGGTKWGRRRAVTAGTAVVLAAIVYGATTIPIPALGLLVSVVSALLAWNVGQYGIRIGEQLGREAATLRVEIAHTAWSAAISLGGIALSYGIYVLGRGSVPIDGLLLLLLGIALSVASLTRGRQM